MDGKRSREALLEFLDYLAKKGLMNKATASARKAAANSVLSILDGNEAEDVTIIDIDQLFVRYANLAGSKYKPESLNVYRGRLKAAIEDFKNYQNNPMTFRPSVQSSGRKVTERPRVGQGEIDAADRSVSRPIASVSSPPPASVSILPIPIRPELVVQIQGLPYDLTPAEANKIANVIRAMASTE
ncbi:hypothetical protein [Mesorhizobium sp. M7A.F.Ca.US.010.02.1.1]|uniref:hypothetical protein n=1 Tax=Mesorhizobium sp. M7A.F.Ca.US.010.02.1.1 TaxID=2496743 RepID=UPI000FD193C5|nr:hypothetical protein [Mesorhizobium sp. M7A.F.Ca.US.010.02.1.1]RUW92284.1 hypothetical protein EOA19_13005 [Mesorhizobium sp. M7A.F.Ca.US.010.02.1.1]